MEPGTSETIVARENPIGSSKPLPCYFDHDGGYDDFVALVYILRHQARFNILGVTVTPANSWREVGVQVTRKILRILHRYNEVSSVSSSNKSGRQQVPVAESTLYGKNPFPDAWRLSCCAINLLPQLNRFETTEEALRLQEGPGVSGEALLAKTLLSAEAPVTLIATGPLTNVAWVLDNFPEASSKIDKVLIMGGAIDVQGNVSVKGFDGSAEWNFFWDPAAAKRVWESDLELVLTPLDATDSVPITKDMILRPWREKGKDADTAGRNRRPKTTLLGCSEVPWRPTVVRVIYLPAYVISARAPLEIVRLCYLAVGAL
ncbi:unnamed protein product [Ascophyllum nodosum]